jgi:hypothetical protein
MNTPVAALPEPEAATLQRFPIVTITANAPQNIAGSQGATLFRNFSKFIILICRTVAAADERRDGKWLLSRREEPGELQDKKS